jgi:ribosomal protein L25 (general stress protein Ctc)
MAHLIHRSKEKLLNGDVDERVIWQVSRSHRQPEGIRYRLAYIRKDGEAPAVLYDNHHPKGHHKHLDGKQHFYAFAGLEKLIEDFEKDIEKANENL